MALANILQFNSYSTIDNIIYSKEGKEFSCYLNIYSDASKHHKITQLYFHVNGNIIIEEVEDVGVFTLPENVVAEKRYIFSQNVKDKYEELAGKTVWWDGSYIDPETNLEKKIENSFSTNNIVWVSSRKIYCKVTDNFPQVNYVCSREFEEFFNKQKILDVGILAASYAYVKSMPLAQGAVDC